MNASTLGFEVVTVATQPEDPTQRFLVWTVGGSRLATVFSLMRSQHSAMLATMAAVTL